MIDRNRGNEVCTDRQAIERADPGLLHQSQPRKHGDRPNDTAEQGSRFHPAQISEGRKWRGLNAERRDGQKCHQQKRTARSKPRIGQRLLQLAVNGCVGSLQDAVDGDKWIDP